MPYSLVTKAGSGIRGVKDLRDKTVAVTSVGSLSDTELLKAADDSDIPRKGLKVINGGVGASIVAAIDKGAAAGMVGDPQLTRLVHSGKYRIVWKPDFDYVSLVALTNTSWVDKHRVLMTDYLRGLTTAEDKSRADRSFAVKALTKERFAVSAGVLDEAPAQAIDNAPKGLKNNGGVCRKTIDVLVQTGPATWPPSSSRPSRKTRPGSTGSWGSGSPTLQRKRPCAPRSRSTRKTTNPHG
ncbi:ABC transporter substrate-binding protein [Streptomyces sp. NPDC094472]|uniref:ABC transporter substrate-binding protein n=1 Tax=Streptomyces sp. NPDC094472 TaxID=3155080 RepID=UPI0033220184